MIAKNIFEIKAYDAIMYGYFCIEFIAFMLKGKSLTDFNNSFSLNNFKEMMIRFQIIVKAVECNFIEVRNRYPCLNYQQFRLNKINEGKDYFTAEIKEGIIE